MAVETNLQSDVIKLEERRYAAMLARDVAALRDIFAEDAIYTHSTGQAHDKQGYLDALASAEYTYRSIERFEEAVKLVDDGAVVTGRIRLNVDFKTGPKLLESRFLSVWVKNGERWQHIAFHSTAIAKA